MAEFKGFEAIIKSPLFPSILEHLKNYPAFLRTRSKFSSCMDMILNESNGTRIIEVANTSPTVRELFYTAHFAACCVLLDGYRFNLNRLRNTSILPEIQQMLTSSFGTKTDQAHVFTQRMVGIDATRTIQLLRLFGLITRQSSEMHQIGLGAGNGDKDINYVHTIPAVRIKGRSGGQKIIFGSSRKHVADIIINDLDPIHKSKYEQFSNDTSRSVTGYVCDTLDLLKELSVSNIRKRNLVTALRIEPAMIPNAREFLHNLYPIVDEDCDFILSIGAGDTPDAYQHRLDVVNDIFNTLQSAQLEPILFRLHLGGTVQQQGSSLQFGSIATSSYEILYCRLSRDSLSKL